MAAKKKTTTNQRPLAVVTGASSGIGYELAKQFAMNGFDLLAVAEDKGILEITPVFEPYAVDVKVAQIDLSRRRGVDELMREIQSLGRPVDAIAINAGVGVAGDFVRETEIDEELNLISLNVASTVYLAKLVLPDMVERGEGKVLFTSSVAATAPGANMAVYNASKAFVQSFAEAIRAELDETGVTITALMPGATETNFFHRAGMDDTKIGVSEKDLPEDVAKQGFEALMAGKDHVVGGAFMNKVQTTLAKIVPDAVKAKVTRSDSEHGSAKKQ